MSKIRFSRNEQEKLRNNKYVLRISDKSITYKDDFKTHFIVEYSKDKLPRIIFEEAGFDEEIIGIKRIYSSADRWKKSYKDKGVMGLRDTRKENTGRPLERELTSEEILRRKDAEIAYLKAELELVKKLDLKERRVIKGKIRPSIIYELISTVINEHDYP